jgi:hypothetical protein
MEDDDDVHEGEEEENDTVIFDTMSGKPYEGPLHSKGLWW